MEKDHITVAAVQMDCVPGDKEENFKIAYELIKEAATKNAQLIVLPELFSTAYRVEENDLELAEQIPGYTTDWLQKVAEEFNVVLIGCIIEEGKVKGVLYDTAIIVDKNGLQGSYRKIYLWDQENIRFANGESYQAYKVNDLTIGLQICYEVGFPEGARILTLQGANILVYPSAFGNARTYAWDTATRARALENGCYVIAANRSGVEKGETAFGGLSRVVDPTGNVIAEASENNEVIVADINLSFVKEQRKTIPYLRDLNTSLVIEELKNTK